MNSITIYEPNQRLKENWLKTWRNMLANIINSRELIIQLFKRDFLMTYKKSFLGMGWILITPIIGIINWALLNSTGILDPGDVGIPYPAYVLLSTSIWGLFMGFYSSSAGTLGAGEGFIMQVNFPHESLLVKQSLQHIINFAITFILNIAVLLLFGVTPDWKIVLFPILTIPLFLLGSSLGLIVGVLSIVSFDVGNVINRILGLLLYITPVIYAPNTDNELLSTIIKYNPLTYLIGIPRDTLIYGETSDWLSFLVVSSISAVLFLISLRLFYVSEGQVIEKMI